MSVVEVLEAARALIANGWTQGAFARDKDGADVQSRDPAAVCWCPLGAVNMASGGMYGQSSSALRVFRVATDLGSIFMWNDAPERTQSDVLAAFDKAIALARSTP